MQNIVCFNYDYCLGVAAILSPHSVTYLSKILKYSQAPEIVPADLTQSHASLNIEFIVYFVETQVQQPKIIVTCV